MDADIYLVGEAPGRTELQTGRPFTGGAGKILDSLLRDAGILRSECRINNLSQKQAPGNQYTRLPEPTKEWGRVLLREDVERVQPNLVVPLGNHPLEFFTGKKGITKWRGSLLWSDQFNCKVLPTIHPAAIMRQWSYAPLALFDLTKASKNAQSPQYHPPNPTLVFAPSYERVVFELSRLMRSSTVAFDIETTRSNEDVPAMMTAIAFSDNDDWSICIPFTRAGKPYWSLEEEASIIQLIAELLESEDVDKIAQNAQFDMGVLRFVYGINVSPLKIDTMCAFHTVYPELPKRLSSIQTLFTDIPYYDDLAKGGDLSFWKYNALDALVTYQIAAPLIEELKEFGTWDFYLRQVHPLIFTLLDMQLRGVRVDQEELTSQKASLEWEREKARRELEEIAGKEVNPNSPKQLAELLYDTLGFPVQRHHRTKKPTTNEEALMTLAKKTHHPVFNAILRYRHADKMVGTYLEAPLHKGRMHTSFNIGGTEKQGGRVVSAPTTGRLSSSRSIIVASGLNMQNIPDGLRKIFVPDEGKLIYEADLSQAEARVVAWLAQAQGLMREFQDPSGDIHVYNATLILGKPKEQITPDERKFAKKHVHAFNYGEGVRQFAKRASLGKAESGVFVAQRDVSVADARKMRDRYFANAPEIPAWHRKVKKKLRSSRTMTTVMGRKRTFFDRWGDSLFRAAIAHEPQSVVADVLNKALVRLDTAFKESSLDAQVLLQVHDSIVFQAREEDEPKIISLLKECFDIPLRIKGSILTIPVELEKGPNWGELKEVTSWHYSDGRMEGTKEDGRGQEDADRA